MTKPWRNITTIWSDKKNCVFVFISVNLTRDGTVEDKEFANYYFEAAGHLIMDEGFNAYNPIVTCDKLLDYPSLCLALGREKSVGGSMPTDIDVAYQFLKMAERGYQRNLANGQTMYQKAFEAVEKMLADSQYDPVREEVDALLEESD